MNRTFREIYNEVETRSKEITYEEYLLVLDALEWKNKCNLLTESLETETDLVYWIEAVRSNQNVLNEWNIDDFKKAVEKAKKKAIELGNKALLHATKMLEKFRLAFSVAYDAFVQLAKNLKLNMNEVFNTLREKGLWEAIKKLKPLVTDFVSDLFVAYKTSYDEASMLIFGTLDKTIIGDALRAGTIKIQNIVEEHPRLKYILGPIIAYTLYYIWTKMVFKGDFLYDFDWSTNISAMLGDFDVVEIFSGQGGIELLTWFALGLTGMFPSAPWLDGDLKKLFKGWGNHALAILTTVLIYINEKYPHIMDRPLIKAIKEKLRNRNYMLTMKKQAFETLKTWAVEQGIYKPCNAPKCGA